MNLLAMDVLKAMKEVEVRALKAEKEAHNAYIERMKEIGVES